MDIWACVVRLCRPRNATSAGTLFVSDRNRMINVWFPYRFLFLLQKTLRKPLAHREVVELQTGIGKREGPDESEQHVRKAFGKRRLMVEGPRRIDID